MSPPITDKAPPPPNTQPSSLPIPHHLSFGIVLHFALPLSDSSALPSARAATSLAIIAETNERQEAGRKPRGLVSSHRRHSSL